MESKDVFRHKDLKKFIPCASFLRKLPEEVTNKTLGLKQERGRLRIQKIGDPTKKVGNRNSQDDERSPRLMTVQ